ncbi:MAG: ATP-dependent DNA helicase [Nitrososphaeria archaeon]|nr:ATP-dependent DNA helicase [Nitrososphaeria archaeon]
MHKEIFPYSFREYQKEFLEFIKYNVDDKNLVINAVTGFGKTPLILAALLPKAFHEGRKIVWVVRTGNEIDRPIEELKRIVEKGGFKFFGFSFRGKRDMCLLIKDMKIKGKIDHEDAKYICDLHKNDCIYYQNLPERVFYRFRDPMLYSQILSECKRLNICPYYFQLKLLPEATVISMSYNYILNENVRWVVNYGLKLKNAFLVVDEAHNLQNACMSLNSDSISETGILKAVREAKSFYPKGGELVDFLKNFLKFLKSECEDVEEEKEFDFKGFVQKFGQAEFVNMIKRLHRVGLIVRMERFRKNLVPRSSLYHLSLFFENSIKNFDVEGVAFILSKDRKGKVRLEMFDMRVSETLSNIWNLSYRCIFCSGTLNPIDEFTRVIGLGNYVGRSFPSIFDEKNVHTIITSYLTTKGEELEKEMAKSFINSINIFIKVIKENIAIYASSYRILENLLDSGLEKVVVENGRRFFLEEEGMSGKKGREILDSFKECSKSEQKGVLCATMFGRFSEGVDFPGKELEGVFLVGVPFERLTVKTKLYIQYFQKLYGEKEGKYYAYILPALKRASQALGRALRSKEDKAVFVLGDKRYKRYLNLLPDFVSKSYKIVRNVEELSQESLKYYKILS